MSIFSVFHAQVNAAVLNNQNKQVEAGDMNKHHGPGNKVTGGLRRAGKTWIVFQWYRLVGVFRTLLVYYHASPGEK